LHSVLRLIRLSWGVACVATAALSPALAHIRQRNGIGGDSRHRVRRRQIRDGRASALQVSGGGVDSIQPDRGFSESPSRFWSR